MSEAIAADDVRRAVAAHDRLITALYGGELAAIAGARLTHNPWIGEPEWNHAGGVALADGADGSRRLDDLLDEVATYFGERGRLPAIVLDPFSAPADLDRELDGRGWSEAFRHAGLIYPAGAAVAEVAWPSGAAVVEAASPPAAAGPASRPEFPGMEVFAAVFEASFAETAGGDLSSGYREAFPAAMARQLPGVDVVHTLVTLDGEPAAVGSRALADGVAGLYNLGVAPRFRRFGLGGAITLHRVAAARAAGADVVYLLTEDPRVEASQRRRGFVPAFELVGRTAAPGT
ncbi:MAG: GNAT family N-acetyltransferase [Thermoanaerobaculia bacterium]|nr:GNAT family N-acetyltransferase [Thermoanaerobaculia bacterium]